MGHRVQNVTAIYKQSFPKHALADAKIPHSYKNEMVFQMYLYA